MGIQEPKMVTSAVSLVLAIGVQLACSLELGTGIYDATGPVNDVLMMGMANPKQVNAGVHQRLRSRAFVAYDEKTKKRFAFVSLDAGMGSVVMNNRVIEALDKRLPGMYTKDNVGISGTHTHSGPSGFLQDVIFQFAGSGWVPETLNAMVSGVVESIVMAHNNLKPGSASVAIAELDGANINRSPTAYLHNSAEERALYSYDTDHNMTMLKLDADDGSPVGSFTFFAVHGTSMNNTNLLVSGDNKGYASYLLEKLKNGPTSTTMPGLGKYVAAFPAANLGDVSPNTGGPKCRDTGLPCDTVHSTCNGKSEQCSSVGPGRDMFESCQIIGQKQFAKAVELEQAPQMSVGGEVDSATIYIKMPGRNVSAGGKHVGNLCKAAVGDSFAAGTTDGPGMFDFTQSANSSNPFWHFIAGFLHKSTPEEKACQAPKGILLPTGSINIPWAWAPSTLPIQIQRIGNFVIIVAPTELTTMAGRRLRTAVKAQMVKDKMVTKDAVMVIAGLANGYADYTVTYEEYQAQRYEGASTIFGPHQLNAYIQEFTNLAHGMATGSIPAGDPAPDDFSSKLINTGKGLSTDYLPEGASVFGSIMSDAKSSYKAGDVAEVEFAGANGLNNLRHQGTFMEVQRCTAEPTVGDFLLVHGASIAATEPNGCPVCTCASPSSWPLSGCNVACGAKCGNTCCCISGMGSCGAKPPPPPPSTCTAWSTVAVDGDWETRISIIKHTVDVVESARTWLMSWYIPADVTPGKYRIVHNGTSYDAPLIGTDKFTEFQGVSSEFLVIA